MHASLSYSSRLFVFIIILFMSEISPVVSSLLRHLDCYLECQRRSPAVAIALKQPLFDYINTLTHQDLITRVPSGENLLTHFILILQGNDAVDGNGFILSALIKRSLFFRDLYPGLLDATTFLLTSPNQNNRTPYQVVESVQNKIMLDSYLTQVTLHISIELLHNRVN